jgi:hypothetical protein
MTSIVADTNVLSLVTTGMKNETNGVKIRQTFCFMHIRRAPRHRRLLPGRELANQA